LKRDRARRCGNREAVLTVVRELLVRRHGNAQGSRVVAGV
jgi:hypothetical protein